MEERLDFLLEDKSRSTGVSIAILISIVIHALLAVYIIRNYRPVEEGDRPAAIVRYVELMRQPSRQFTEAPGAKTNTAPLNAPFSDANSRASMPKPTGDQPTLRPGERGLYTPPSQSGSTQRARQAQAAESELTAPPQQQAAQSAPEAADPSAAPGGTFTYHPTQASAGINWQNAIREVGKVASLGKGSGVDLGNEGGEKGFAESGPLSFESQWYDWGDYAQSMVSRIRVNWYNNMPQLIQTGLKGVVTIRFTIHRDGSITDITILSSSGVPPYDFAAKKAIELSSPLNPLPKDFPNPTERVTCMFFYNQEPPTR